MKRFVTLLLLCLNALTPSFGRARGDLKAGIYHNLKTREAIVLDTGTFVFIGLELKDMGKYIWLDGRKAKSITLSHCRFEGNNNDTCLLASGVVTIGHSEFKNFQTAILYQDQDNKTLKVFRNHFSENDSAIVIYKKQNSETLKLSFSLKCNEFSTSSSAKINRIQKGLVIGKGVELGYTSAGIFLSQRIGSGERNFWDSFEYPNGNIWPGGSIFGKERKVINGIFVDIHNPDSNLAVANHPNWISIDNQSGNSLQYYRYEGEFVGWGKAILGEVVFVPSETNRKWQLDVGMVSDTCAYKLQQAKGQASPFVCEQLIDEQPFLLPTHWQRDMTKENLNPPKDNIIFVGEPEYERQSDLHRIRIWLPKEIEQAVLQYLDKDGLTVLQTNYISGRAWSEAILDFRYTEPGVYFYRLISDGKAGNTKKLIVVH